MCLDYQQETTALWDRDRREEVAPDLGNVTHSCWAALAAVCALSNCLHPEAVFSPFSICGVDYIFFQFPVNWRGALCQLS